MLPRFQILYMAHKSDKHFLKQIVRICCILHLRQSQPIDHIRISVDRCLRRYPLLFWHKNPPSKSITPHPARGNNTGRLLLYTIIHSPASTDSVLYTRKGPPGLHIYPAKSTKVITCSSSICFPRGS